MAFRSALHDFLIYEINILSQLNNKIWEKDMALRVVFGYRSEIVRGVSQNGSPKTTCPELGYCSY